MQNDIVNSMANQCPTKTEITNIFSPLPKLEKRKITQYSKSQKNYITKHRKGRKAPIALQPKVKVELENYFVRDI